MAQNTRKLAASCSKHCEVDRTDEVSNHTYGKATLTWFEFDFRRVLVQTAVVVIILHGFNFAKKVTISDLREEVMVGSSC
ncbi:chlorohydrolase [Streptococcus pneumoniae]|nr:chlorohydrolase [Streptococcus pneumoniae]